MGMDVMGRKPTTPKGEYFRNNVWWWHPLADYCAHAAPQLWGKVKYPHSNDGSGLGARDSKALATILEAEIASGRAQMYADARRRELDALPDEKCSYCDGTGERHDQYVDGTCNSCGGRGKVRPFDTNYPFSVENVQAFAAFLRDCGGFEIF